MARARRPDNLKLNQLALVIEREYDSSKDIDFGFRMDQIFGTDSQLNASFNLLDNESHETSYDIAQLYGQLWIKTGDDQGLELTFGKWYTTVGSEVIPSPDNWLYSRSMLFGYGPFTHTGLLARYYFSSNFNIHLGASRGWDQWGDLNKGVSWHAGFGWDSEEQMGDDARSSLSFAFIAGPEEQSKGYGGQNRWIWNVVWKYHFTEQLTGLLDTYFAWEEDVPDSLNSSGRNPRRRDNAWYGVAYSLNYEFNKYVSATGRVEWFADKTGARTGYRGHFFSPTIGAQITPFPDDPWLSGLLIRPELRADFSDNNEPFADDCQFTGAINVVYSF
jgi:hypothetical protein